MTSKLTRVIVHNPQHTDKGDDVTPLMTPADVAKRCNVSLRAAYDMLSTDGPLGHLRIKMSKKVVRIEKDAFEQYLKEQAGNDAN